MASYINTNIASLDAQRNLTTSQSALQTSIQRLSSGLRINSAKDDAAGLAIAARFTTQINGLDQASRNANDGISLAQTADGTLASVSDNLQRIRELAVQAANSTNSSSDRAAINQEVQQRLQEIDRSTSQASFNGQKVLDGSFGTATFQVGANAGETISVALGTSMRTNSIGAIATTTTAASVGALASGGTLTTGTITPGDFSIPTAAAVDGSNSSTAATRLFSSSTTGGNISVASTTTDFSTASSPAVNESISFTPGTRLYGTAGSAGTGGTIATGNVNAPSFGTAAVAQIDGTNVQTVSGGTGFDFSGANLAQFNVVTVGGGTQSVTLTTNTSDEAGMAAAIQAQLTGITVVGDTSAHTLTFTNTGSTDAVQISNVDTNGGTIGGLTDTVGTAGTAATPTTNASFEVDGNVVNLTANYTNDLSGHNAAAAAIQGQLAGYTATWDNTGDKYDITNNTAGSAAVAITANSSATADEQANAISAGFVAASGTAGTASQSTTNASFTLDGKAVTLNSNYADYNAVASAIGAAMGSSYTVANNSGTITVSKNGAQGSTLAVTGADTNAIADGFNSGTTNTGSAAVNSTAANFEVDGHAVALTTNLGTTGAVANSIQSQLSSFGSGYTVSYAAGAYTVTNNTQGSAAVAITNADPGAGTDGFANGTGTAGSTINNNASFDVDGTAVTLNTNYADDDALATGIQSQLSGYTVTNNSGTIKISKNGSTAAVAITNADTNATNSGFANSAGTAGSAATTSTALSFNVDGSAITLTGDDSTVALVKSDLQTQLDAASPGTYTVAGTGSLSITNNTAGSAAVAITGANTAAGTAGFADATGTAGATGGSVTLTDFSIQAGDNAAVSLDGTYTDVNDLADEINKSVQGAYASVSSDGKLMLTSSGNLTLGGADATGALGFASDTVTANDGSLNNVDTLTVDDANDAIQRVDSALTSVNGLRSTFGAIENRFDSVISNISSTNENLSAARSRIQDADFASETANMTRAQILQQAGTAMLAQANSLPNGVLALLR